MIEFLETADALLPYLSWFPEPVPKWRLFLSLPCLVILFNTLIMKRMKMFLVFFLGMACSLQAEVKYGEVDGGGIHKDFTDGGKTKGVGSASYDYWISDGPWNAPPALGFGDQSWDNEGAVLLALNPYTGEIFTQVAANDQYFNPEGSYSGGGHRSLGLPSDFKAAGGIYPDAENNPLPDSLADGNLIVFTTELRPDGGGNYVIGLYAIASYDGAILGEFDPGHAGITTYNPHFLRSGETVGSSGSFDGADIRVYCGYIGWGGAAWFGQFGGGGQRGIGFELDGKRGWIRIDVSGDRAGLVLKEYYFDAEAPLAPGELEITEFSSTGTAAQLSSLDITFTSVEGGVYAVDYKESLDRETWSEIEDGIIGEKGSTTWSDDNQLHLSRKSGFYRVRDVSQ
jgi:hypothetical protein